MRKEMEKICDLFRKTHKIGIKIMERGGRKSLADIGSDPLGTKLCNKEDCTICRVPGSKGGCMGRGVGYRQICTECPYSRADQSQSAIYEGETGRSAYKRGTEHTDDVRKHDSQSPLWKHCVIQHESREVKFIMEVTGRFKVPAVRQGDEGCRVRESRAKWVLNSKTEWHQPPIIRVVAESGNRNLDQEGAAEAGLVQRDRGRGRGRGRARAGRRQ
jgi:hypothetical protein